MSFHPSRLMLPVDHLQQRASGDCLAICAAMALNYLGLTYDYERLTRLLRIKRPYGTPFSNIRELSKQKITVTLAQGTLEDLYNHLLIGHPCIVPVQTGQLPYWTIDTSHAVIVVGMDSEFIYLNDPDLMTGPIQVLLGDFDLAWLEHDEFYAVLVP